MRSTFGQVTPQDKPGIRKSSYGVVDSLMGSILDHTQPPKTLRKYRVVQCPNSKCGRIQVTTARSFKCSYCGRSSVFRSRCRWAVNLIQSDDFRRANELCRHWNACVGVGVTGLEEVVRSFVLTQKLGTTCEGELGTTENGI